MKIDIIGDTPSAFTQILAELRDEDLQQDRFRFRTNLEKAGEILAYELSKHLKYENVTITTPLGISESFMLLEQPLLVCILRAAIPLQSGFLRIFDKADNAFVSAYRAYTNENKFIVKVEYVSTPDITDRIIIFLDPMIATGKSMVTTYHELQRFGEPKSVYIAGLIASEEGIEYLQRTIPNAHIIIGAIDNELTAKGYIVPGLGDAGDLCFGSKN